VIELLLIMSSGIVEGRDSGLFENITRHSLGETEGNHAEPRLPSYSPVWWFVSYLILASATSRTQGKCSQRVKSSLPFEKKMKWAYRTAFYQNLFILRTQTNSTKGKIGINFPESGFRRSVTKIKWSACAN